MAFVLFFIAGLAVLIIIAIYRSFGNLFRPIQVLDVGGQQITKHKLNQEATNIHLIVLVHGYNGTKAQLKFVKEAFENEIQTRSRQQHSPLIPKDTQIIVHSATTISRRTDDGIQMGGERLAKEIDGIIQNLFHQKQNENDGIILHLSMIGYSFGGMLARYSLKLIYEKYSMSNNSNRVGSSSNIIRYNQFVTLGAPNLGQDDGLIYLPFIPRIPLALVNQTSRDLFGLGTTIVYDMCMNEEFTKPLECFCKRTTIVNSFSTDLMVTPSTGAFLGNSDEYHTMHYVKDRNNKTLSGIQNNNPSVELEVETSKYKFEMHGHNSFEVGLSEKDIMAKRLDSMGWTKVFVNFSTCLPYIQLLPDNQRRKEQPGNHAYQYPTAGSIWTSSELRSWFGARLKDGRVYSPFAAHFIIVGGKPDNKDIHPQGKLFVIQLVNEMLSYAISISRKQHRE